VVEDSVFQPDYRTPDYRVKDSRAQGVSLLVRKTGYLAESMNDDLIRDLPHEQRLQLCNYDHHRGTKPWEVAKKALAKGQNDQNHMQTIQKV
jgi:hypothetical protein